MRSAFWKFSWNSCLFWAASRRWCPIFRTVALPLQVISIQGFTHLDQRDWSPEVWILNAILAYGWARPDGNRRRPDSRSDLLITVFLKEILNHVEHWELFGRATETSRRMQAGAVWSFLTQRMVRMKSSRRTDGICFGQLGVRTVWHVVQTAGREPNFLTCQLFRIFWKHSE
jgi:hypothetical protein